MATHDPGRHPASHSTHDATHAHGAHGAHGAHAHGAHAHQVVPGSDQRPAFMGLIVGGVALFVIMWGTVLLTNRQFAGHGESAKDGAAAKGAAGARPAATATAPAPAAH